MRTIDFLPRPRFIDALRNWIGLKPTESELERRQAIIKDYGWPPVAYRGPRPDPPPMPPPRKES